MTDQPTEKRELRWRGNLLSSSLPLEYRTARLLVDNGYSVTPDASYTRTIESTAVEFSIDILASLLVRLDDGIRSALVRLLVECKYRRPGKAWFFVPDPERITITDWDPARIIRCCDQFSTIECPAEPFERLGERITPCYKGVEIDFTGGTANRVSTEELKHGLEQLQFGIAMLLFDKIRASLIAIQRGIGDRPFVFAPILVTTAPLYVARPDLTDESIVSSADIESFADNVGWLTLRTNPWHKLSEHVGGLFSSEGSSDVVRAGIDWLQNAAGRGGVAADAWGALVAARPWMLTKWFSEVLVCTDTRLGELLQLLQSTAAAVIAGANRKSGGSAA